MQQEYDDTNRGVLFAEDNPKTDKHPTYTGKINVDGRELRLVGWKKISKGGKPFLSLAVSEFKEFAVEKQDNEPTNEEVDKPIDLSEIPF